MEGWKLVMSDDLKREMISISLCVTGLTLMVLGFFVVVDNLNLPILLGLIIGSSVSTCNYLLNVVFSCMALKHSPQKARIIIVLSKIFRSFLIGLVVYVIILLPSISIAAGIIPLLFVHISKGITILIRGNS